MNLFRFLFVFAALAAFNGSSLFAQVAVERPDASPAATPAAEEAPLPEAPAEATPVKKKKKAAAVETTTTATETGAAPVTAKTLGMTEDQFRKAGLDKLSQPELQALAISMGKQKQEVSTKAKQQAQAEAQQEIERTKAEADEKIKKQAKQKIDTVESFVVSGHQQRLTGRSIFTLEDGTRWKQSMADDHYPGLAAERPPVKIVHTAFGWKMTVAGWPEMYVDPIR